jgi:tetratricopeptide (TPR) repeat protein
MLADRLARGLADLHDPGTSDPRHATLHATIAWSQELLTEPDQRLLERLSVFAGPFVASAAAAVAGTEPVAADRVPDALRTLARRSLLVPVADSADGQPRWRMLEVVRAFGHARLRARGEDQVVRSRHLEYVADLVGAAADHRHGPDQGAWVTWLREVEADLDVALATAVDLGDRPRWHQLVSGAWLWWYLDERHDDALTWLDRIGEEMDPPAALLAAGALVHAVQLEDDHRDRALVLADRALTRTLASGDAGELAYVQLLVGDALTRTPQRFEEAEKQLIAAEQHFRAHGPAWAEGWTLLRRIRVDGFHRADLTVARDRLATALARLEEAGDHQLLAYANLVLANISRLHGTLELGLTAIADAIRSYEELGYVLPLRECRHLQGLLLTELGRLDDAAERWRAQQDEAERTGSATGRFFATLGLSEVLARRGAHAEAAGPLEAERRAWAGTDDPGVLGPLLVVLTPVSALLATTPEEVDRVAVLRDGLLTAWGEGPVPWHQVRAQLAAGEAALALADHPTAARHLDEAGRVAGTATQPHRLAEVAEARAVLAAVDGDAVGVLTLLGGAARLRADTGAAAWHHVVTRSDELAAAARDELGAGAASAAWRRGEGLGPAVLPECASPAGS